jgi:hypothetical protein
MYDRMSLNLASHPLKNRRFFFTCLVISVIFIIGVLGWGGYIYFKYHGEVGLISTTIDRLNALSQQNLREKTRYQTQIEAVKKEYQGKIDYMNNIIWKKSFPWLDLLAALEKSLPDTCYIVSMTPNIDKEKWLTLRFEVASPAINDLLEFITNLNALNLDKINLSSENRNKEGLLLTEVTLRYARTI